MPQNSSAKTEPMSASGEADMAQNAPVTLADRIKNGGWDPNTNPTAGTAPIPEVVMGGTGDPYNLVKEG